MALILLLLIGAVFGFGFKVRISRPSNSFDHSPYLRVEIMHEQGSVSTALVTTVAVIAIQMGYLIGVLVRVGMDSGVTAAPKAGGRRQHGFQNWFSSFVRR